MADITFDGVTKIYADKIRAVDELSLHVADGEFMVLVGPSGCGKTTALRMLAGLEDITSGSLSIGGAVVNNVLPKDRDVAMVFQNYALYPHMTVAQNMGFALKIRGHSKFDIATKVSEAAAILRLTDYLDRRPKALSGGQRQRVAMGRAIVRSPQAFLMDEPLSNLDAQLRVEMRLEIARIQRLLGVATVYVTHDQIEAMTMGDRVAVMRGGKLQQCDTPQDLYDHPRNEFVAGFMGSPPMNLLRAGLDTTNGASLVLGTQRVAIPSSYASSHALPARDGLGVVFGIRPEDVQVVGADDDAGSLTTKVERREALGAEILVHLSLVDAAGTSTLVVNDDGAVVARPTTMVAKMGPRSGVAVGDQLRVRFNPDHFHFFDADSGDSLRKS
ncbi:MAG TPA: sn-glycerol-3-phosphate ABC transporter ATP-binding protein UgpC [Acidimicrobiales bacterium]